MAQDQQLLLHIISIMDSLEMDSVFLQECTIRDFFSLAPEEISQVQIEQLGDQVQLGSITFYGINTNHLKEKYQALRRLDSA